ncbi:amidinotransferase [Cryomorphaceae bacterium]|nr:amidinotransferase [Cryomorphaceae bacterium]
MASRVFMVRPAAFGPNPQTAQSNAFQSEEKPPDNLPELARLEFDALVHSLRNAGVLVEVFDEPSETANPDAVFPNNWVSFHPKKGRVFLYPMLAPTRRDERRPQWVDQLVIDWPQTKITDLSPHEKDGRFLEGTGSLIFDPLQELIFATRSPRTDDELVHQVATDLGLRAMLFDAFDKNGQAIYHTNVVFGLGQHLAMGCWEAIPQDQRIEVITTLNSSNRPVMHLNHEQMASFAGNWIELEGHSGPVMALSKTAWQSLQPSQKAVIQDIYEVVVGTIPLIETFGGGSVRCMICSVDAR